MAFKQQAEWLPVFGGCDEVFAPPLLVQRKTWNRNTLHGNTLHRKRQAIKHGSNRVRKVRPHTAAPLGIAHGQPGR